jgi:UDP-N-acetylglucosamine acyltransferase
LIVAVARRESRGGRELFGYTHDGDPHMPTIHRTAVIEGDVQLADDASIGPFCVLDGTAGPIKIGSGTRLKASVHLAGPLMLGENNTLFPCTCIGFAPQDLKWDPHRPGAGVVIGDDNTFRESVTMHRATSDETPTIIGNKNYFMATSHAGHDSCVGDECTLAQGAMLGGFVTVGDHVTIGGATGVHQYCRIGRGAMLSSGVALMQDLPPHFMLTGTNLAGGLNLIGLRRALTPSSVIDDIHWVFRTLYRSGFSMKTALIAMRERAINETINEYVLFIEQSRRGICQGASRAARANG